MSNCDRLLWMDAALAEVGPGFTFMFQWRRFKKTTKKLFGSDLLIWITNLVAGAQLPLCTPLSAVEQYHEPTSESSQSRLVLTWFVVPAGFLQKYLRGSPRHGGARKTCRPSNRQPWCQIVALMGAVSSFSWVCVGCRDSNPRAGTTRKEALGNTELLLGGARLLYSRDSFAVMSTESCPPLHHYHPLPIFLPLCGAGGGGKASESCWSLFVAVPAA